MPVLLLLQRELQLMLRQHTALIYGAAFMLVAVSVFPFAVGQDPALLARIAGGVIWVCALLAAMLSFTLLFERDWQDGTLEQLWLCGTLPEIVVGCKMLTHWLLSGLPTVLIAPLLGLLLGLTQEEILALMLSLLLGTPVLTCIGTVGAALTVGSKRAGRWLPLLVLPLCIPVLIFGVAVSQGRSDILPLIGLDLLLIPLSLTAATLSLRHALQG